MKRAFFRKPAPSVDIRTRPLAKAFLQKLRQQILNRIISGALIIGTLAVIASAPGRLQEGNWTLLILFAVAISLFLILRFVPAIPYTLRAFLLLAVVAALGVFTFLSDGLIGNGRIYLLAIPMLAGILVGLWGSIASLLSSILFVAMMGILTLNGSLSPYAGMTGKIPLSYWLISISTFILVSSTVTISLIALVNGLEASLRKERELSDQLELERASLETRVVQRTKDVERRLAQIRTAADIARSIGSYLDEKEILAKVVNQMRAGFDLYYVGVFLLDESETGDFTTGNDPKNMIKGSLSEKPIYAFLRAGTGEEGELMLQAGHKLPVFMQESPQQFAEDSTGPSMIGWAITHRKPRIALDVGKEAVRFDNPYLPLTRSELALPLVSGDCVLGAMTIQSSQSMAFDQDDIIAMQGVADSLSTALVNARLFGQVRQNLDDIRNLNRQYLAEAWSQVVQARNKVEFVSEDPLIRDGVDKTSGPSSNHSQKEVVSVQFPLSLRNQMIGELSLETEGSALSMDDQSFVEAVATQAAQALENVRLLEKTQQQVNYERLVADFSRKIRRSSDLEGILRIVVQEVGQAMGASEAVIRLELPANGANSVCQPNLDTSHPEGNRTTSTGSDPDAPGLEHEVQ